MLAVCTYALVAISVLCWWPDRIWGSGRHLVFSLVAVAMTVVGVNIALQLRAVERAAVLAEKHWRALAAVVEHSDDAIVAVGLDGRLTAFNAGAERLYGCHASEVIGTTMAAFSESVVPAVNARDAIHRETHHLAASAHPDRGHARRRRDPGASRRLADRNPCHLTLPFRTA